MAPLLLAALSREGLVASLHFASGVGDAGTRARTASSEEWDGVVVVGGDGTVNEVLNGLTDLTIPLGALPTGTANVLAHELRLPRDPDAVARMIAAGHTRDIAVGIANNQRFLLFCGVGFDGAVAERQAKSPGRVTGKLKWAAPICNTVWWWPSYSLSVLLPDGRVIDQLQSVIVARVRNYGGVLNMTPNVRIESGQLHLMCFRMKSRREWAWQVLRALVGKLRPGRLVEVHDVNALQIIGSAPCQIDGDFRGNSPVSISLSSESATVFAPR